MWYLFFTGCEWGLVTCLSNGTETSKQEVWWEIRYADFPKKTCRCRIYGWWPTMHTWFLPEPEIGLEEEIRKKIAETLRNSDDTHDVTLTLTLNTLACLSSHTDDFEFLEASGKTMCVPARSKELEWTGGGCVSIFDWRLTSPSAHEEVDKGNVCVKPFFVQIIMMLCCVHYVLWILWIGIVSQSLSLCLWTVASSSSGGYPTNTASSSSGGGLTNTASSSSGGGPASSSSSEGLTVWRMIHPYPVPLRTLHILKTTFNKSVRYFLQSILSSCWRSPMFKLCLNLLKVQRLKQLLACSVSVFSAC